MDPLRARQYTPAEDSLGERWAVYERILGLYPAIPNDLIASMLFCIVFLALLVGCFFVWRQKSYRSLSIYILSTACLTTFLGFAVRTGISNTFSPTRASFMVECMLFIIGQLCLLDVWVMRARDELKDGNTERDGNEPQAVETPGTWLQDAQKTWESRLALFSRFLVLPLSFLLYVIGYAMIPSASDEKFNSHDSLKVRGGASFLPILNLAIMVLVFVLKACFHGQAWLPSLLFFFASTMLWLPVLYAFCLVSITVDSSSLVRSKSFFYASYGFAQAVCVIILLFLTRRPATWAYREPSETPKPEPPLKKYAYVPQHWVKTRVVEVEHETAEAAA